MNDDAQNTSFELGALYRKARSGEITLTAFFDELDAAGITNLIQAIHAANAFGIGLNVTKKAFIERQPGGMAAWEAQFEDIDLENLE